MTAIPPISAIASMTASVAPSAATPVVASPGATFESILTNGIKSMETKVANAEELARRFAIDGDVPIHHVTMAMEEARLSVEMAMQVRARMVEAYRDLMNMQL